MSPVFFWYSTVIIEWIIDNAKVGSSVFHYCGAEVGESKTPRCPMVHYPSSVVVQIWSIFLVQTQNQGWFILLQTPYWLILTNDYVSLREKPANIFISRSMRSLRKYESNHVYTQINVKYHQKNEMEKK